jgi:serine/threonine protein kinase
MALVNLHVLDETDYGGDAFTSTTLARVQVGHIAWQWQRQLTFVRLHPHLISEPWIAQRFRSVMAAWRETYLPHNPQLFHDEPHGEPFAIFEYEGGRTLESVFGALAPTAPLSRAAADNIVEAVHRGLAARHELGIAHGAIGLDRIALTDVGVTLGIGAPWDPGAGRDDDLRRAEQLGRARVARTRGGGPAGWLALAARRPS